MIIDAISGEMYVGSHYVHGGAKAWLWGGGVESIITPPGVPGAEYVWVGDRLHHVWKGDRLHYVWTGDRLHYQAGEEL